jgi:hypothetical protein
MFSLAVTVSLIELRVVYTCQRRLCELTREVFRFGVVVRSGALGQNTALIQHKLKG